jgi:hypothetical protein
LKIWLDDVRPMPVHFTHHAKNADEARKLLLTGQVEVISFDFELGDVGYETGGDLTAWIAEQAKLNSFPPPTAFYFHSSNYYCNHIMKDNIQEALKHWEDHEKEKASAS